MPDSDPNSPLSSPRVAARRWLFVGGLGIALLTGMLIPHLAFADVEDEYILALQFYKQDRWDFAAAKFQQFLKDAPPNHEKVPLAKLYLGQALVHQRQFESARPVFREFVAQHPQHQDIALAMYRVGECSYFVNDFAAAEKELTSFLDRVPADHPLAEWALQYLGESELQLGHHQQAIQSFETGIKQFEAGRLAEELRFGLARAYEGANRDVEARKLYEQLATGTGRRAADAEFNLAAHLFEDEQYQPAAQRFAAVVEKYPEHRMVPLAMLNAGYSHYHLGEFDEAVSQFSQVTGDDQLGPTAEYWIGLSLKSQEKYAAAGDALVALYQRQSQHSLAESILFHAADSRLGAKDYAAAQKLFQDVTRRWPQGELADDSLHLATEAAILAGDQLAASALHRQFQTQFPDSGLRFPQELLWGRILLVEGDELDGEQAAEKYTAAVAAFTEVIQRSTIPETKSLATLQLARAWDRLQKPEEVLRTLQPLADQAGHPDAPDAALRALVMTSSASLTLKKYPESIAAATAYLSHQATGPEAADALANISLAQAHLGQWEVAEESLLKLQGIGNQPLSDRISYEVAEIAYDAQNWAEAEGLYRQLAEQARDGEFYRPALSGLAYSLHQQGRILLQEAEKASGDSSATAGTSQLAAAIGKFDDAARWFARLVEVSTQHDDPVIQSDARYMQGLSLRLARRLSQATKTFMDALDRHALPPEAQQSDETRIKAAYNAYRSAVEAARVFQDLEQLESAEHAYQAAYEQLQKQPAERQTGIDALINEWALMHYNADDFDRAAELFAMLIQEQPTSSWADDARMLLAEGDYFAEKYEPAREALRQLIASEQTDDFVRERSLLLLMDIAVRLDDWKDVDARATQLTQQFPKGRHHWEAEYRRGEAALRREQYADAEMIFSQLTMQRSDPSLADEEWFPGVWLMLAEAQLRLRQYDALERTVEQFADMFPGSPLSYHMDDVQGRAYQKQARFEDARAAFARVIESSEGKGTETAAKAQLFTAETFLIEKKYEQAFEAYYLVLKYGFPQWQAAALIQAGKCEAELKRWAGAAKSYRQLLEDFPESDYADEARRLLIDIERRFPQTVGP